MKKVAILALEQSLPMGITAVSDIFKMAGVGWDERSELTMEKLFRVEAFTVDGKPIRYTDIINIIPHGSIADAHDADIIIIPSSGFRGEELESYPEEILEWLRKQYTLGVDIAACCTGVFVLAESGLLNGKLATTHWDYTDRFRNRYPEVKLKPEEIITEDRSLFCSGGGSACFDLCTYMIERSYGTEVANRCSKILLFERGRNFQTPFKIFHFQKNHQDSEILRAQQWIEESFRRDIIIDDVATFVGLGIRNFKRRFKKATGETPIVYIQKIRIEAAKKILEYKDTRIEEISGFVGYEDPGFFRKLFLRYVGMNPTDYRRKFRGCKISRSRGVKKVIPL